MEVNKKTNDFDSYTIEIKVQSRADELVLGAIGYLNISIPEEIEKLSLNTVPYKDIGEGAYSLSKNFLRKLKNALES